MKKYFLFLMLLLSSNVYAGEFKKIDGTCIISDYCKVEEIKKYNTFSINYIDKGYLDDNDLYIKDESDFIEEEGTEFIHIHTYVKEDNKIVFSFLPTDLKIYELEIYYNDELINYSPRIAVDVIKSERLYDKDLETYYLHRNNQSFFVVYLDDTYILEDIKIRFYTKQQDNKIFSFSYKDFIMIDNSIDRWHEFTFSSDVTGETEYRIEKNKKYRYYEEEKIINNEYVLDGDNIILDDYITQYIYYMKEETNEIIEDSFIETNTQSDNDFSCNNEIVIENEDNNIVELISNKVDFENYIYLDTNDVAVNEQLTETNILAHNDNITSDVIPIDNDIDDNNNIDNDSITYSLEETTSDKKKKNKKSKKIKILVSIILIIIDIILIIKKRKTMSKLFKNNKK